MQLIETIIIKKNHLFYKEIDELAFKSKNLYNASLYLVKQEYLKNKKYLSAYDLRKILKESNQKDYIALPRKVSMQVLFQLDESFKSFFKALKSHKKNPNKFKAKPKLPKYKDKIKGRNFLVYDKQAISVKNLKKDLIHLSQTNIIFKPQKATLENINQVQLIKKHNCYVIATIYTIKEKPYQDNEKYAAIDLGLNNLAAVTFSNNKTPILINGKPLKSINQYFNKKKAALQQKLSRYNLKTSNKIKVLTLKRNNKINDYLHKASRKLINQLVSYEITNLIIGYSKNWKQEINIGKVNNQNFVNVPFLKFIQMLSYKGKLQGISINLQEESYTSKCSFLDLEEIRKHKRYLGRRIKRGLFKSSFKRCINADVNGSFNIMRKVAPKKFSEVLRDEGVEGISVYPISIKI